MIQGFHLKLCSGLIKNVINEQNSKNHLEIVLMVGVEHLKAAADVVCQSFTDKNP